MRGSLLSKKGADSKMNLLAKRPSMEPPPMAKGGHLPQHLTLTLPLALALTLTPAIPNLTLTLSLP